MTAAGSPSTEQGYVTRSRAGSQDLEGNYPILTFGKFNAPIGFELLDAPDMYQYSHSLVFSRGLPTNLTGAMLAMDLGGRPVLRSTSTVDGSGTMTPPSTPMTSTTLPYRAEMESASSQVAAVSGYDYFNYSSRTVS